MSGAGGSAALTGVPRRLYHQNLSLLRDQRLHRVLALAGHELRFGLPGSRDGVLVWGRSPTAWRGERLAARNGLALVRVEDAFLRSVHPGRSQREAPLGYLIDPEFRVKARFAPWVDVLLRCQGPVVRQMQCLFLSGWIPEKREAGLEALPSAEPVEQFADGCLAQVFETGPVTRHNAMSDMFVASMYAARTELLITTPYFVPDEAMLRALCAAPRRGVKTTVIFPARNDSWLVGNASRSSYADLLACGVAVHTYPLGLLHAKTLTLDGQVALVGSANMDRRSLELNFENNLLIADPAVTASIRERQLGYLSVSPAITAEEVARCSPWRRLVQNAVGMMAPVL